MKRILIAFLCILFAAAVLPTRSTAKPASKPAGAGKPDAVSSEDGTLKVPAETRLHWKVQ